MISFLSIFNFFRKRINNIETKQILHLCLLVLAFGNFIIAHYTLRTHWIKDIFTSFSGTIINFLDINFLHRFFQVSSCRSQLFSPEMISSLQWRLKKSSELLPFGIQFYFLHQVQSFHLSFTNKWLETEKVDIRCFITKQGITLLKARLVNFPLIINNYVISVFVTQMILAICFVCLPDLFSFDCDSNPPFTENKECGIDQSIIFDLIGTVSTEQLNTAYKSRLNLDLDPFWHI